MGAGPSLSRSRTALQVQAQAQKSKPKAFVEGSESPNPYIIVLGTGAALAATVFIAASLFAPKYDDHVGFKVDASKEEVPTPLPADKAPPSAFGGKNPAPASMHTAFLRTNSLVSPQLGALGWKMALHTTLFLFIC